MAISPVRYFPPGTCSQPKRRVLPSPITPYGCHCPQYHMGWVLKIKAKVWDDKTASNAKSFGEVAIGGLDGTTYARNEK